MIYFDNAATGGFKPRAVTDAANTVTRFLCANPGRSGHRLSLMGEKTIFTCRELLSQMFTCSPERVAFTKNCTEALNTAIFGTAKSGGHVITTTFEHNSVLRPLTHLKQTGAISLDIVSPTENKNITNAIKEKITDSTYLIVMSATSNVTGEELPVSEVGALCKQRKILFLVDGAQGGGHVQLNMQKQNISMLALPAHKGLYGIMGAGALLIADGVEVSPLTFGGTGNESFSLVQPKGYPERLESGTLPLPAIAAFCEGVRYIKSNVENFGDTLLSYTDMLISGLNNLKGITVFSNPNKAGIVAFKFENIPSGEASDVFNAEYDVAVRGGLHCAPLTHRYLDTEDGGLIRASLAVQNSTREISYFLRAVKNLSNKS